MFDRSELRKSSSLKSEISIDEFSTCSYSLNLLDTNPSKCSFTYENGLYTKIIISNQEYPISNPTTSLYLEGDSVTLYPLSLFQKVVSLESSNTDKDLVACLKENFKNKDGYFFTTLVLVSTRGSVMTEDSEEYVTFFIKENGTLIFYDTDSWTCQKNKLIKKTK